MSEVTKTWYELTFTYTTGQDGKVFHYNDIISNETNIPDKANVVAYLIDKYPSINVIDVGTLTLVEEIKTYKTIEY